MATQATSKLVIVNGMPAVEGLWNGRYRLEFFCDPSNKNEGWYSGNIDQWLPEYGALQDHAIENGWEYPENSDVAYDDMRLVERDVPFIPSASTHYVRLVYETLTDAYVQEKDDTIDYELNGLKRVTRTSVALPETAYTGVVGEGTSMDSDGTTVYLSSYQIDETDAKWTLTESWIEAGTLRVTERTEAEGVKSVTTTFLVTEGSVVGPIVDRDTNNFEGLKTIIVKSLQDKDGNPLGANGDDPVSQFDQYIDFRYPGEVSIAYDQDTVTDPSTGEVGTIWNKYWYSLIPPVTSAVNARVYVFFQTSDEIVASDLVYDGAIGLWNPDEWARGVIDGLGTNFSVSSVQQSAQDKVFNEYTVVAGGNNSVSGTGDYANTAGGATMLEGSFILPTASYSMDVSGGPGRPDGNKYVIQPPTLTPAFDDVDGNQVWKKVIIVATV